MVAPLWWSSNKYDTKCPHAVGTQAGQVGAADEQAGLSQGRAAPKGAGKPRRITWVNGKLYYVG